jgi:L-arginine dehydrogenase
MNQPDVPLRVMLDSEVASLLEPRAIVESLESAFRQLGSDLARQPGQVQVPLPSDAGDTIYYTAALSHPPLVAVTVSPFLLARLRLGLSPVTAWTMLISSESGEVIAVMESRSLIAARTGGTTWIAAKRLAPRLDKVAIIGSGQVAEWHLRHLCDAPCAEIAIYSPRLATVEYTARRARLQQIDERVRVAESAKSAVTGAGVVMLCTASASPVIELAWSDPDALITSVTTDGVNAHEISPLELRDLEVYCDFRATTPAVAGEMILARQLFGWSDCEIVMDLPELLREKARLPSRSRGRRYFRSVGLGIEDLAAAATVLPFRKS